jgi:diguanylate cyclase (GGDEF)-like protein
LNHSRPTRIEPPRRRRLADALGSLKLRITAAAIAALVVCIGLTTALFVRQAEHDTLSAQRHRELDEAVRTASMLSTRVVELQRALHASADRLTAATLPNDTELAAMLESQPVLRSMFSILFVADANGRVRVLSDARGVRHPDMDLTRRRYFQRTLKEQRAIISEPLAAMLTGEPVVVLSYPLMHSGRVLGVLGGAMRLAGRDLLGDLTDSANADSAAMVVVTDADGRVLSHPNPARLMQRLSTEPRMAQAFAQWTSTGSAVEPAGLHLEQSNELVSAAGVPGPDWMVWRTTPHAELLAPIQAARRQTLLWAAVLVAAISLVTPLLLWWLLRPLTQLEHRAEHLFDGTQDPNAGWPHVGGELGRLAHVLQHVGAERARLEVFNTGLLKKLGSVMSAAPMGICFTRQQRFELANAEFCRLFARTEADLVGALTRSIYVSQADHEAMGPRLAAAFGAGLPYDAELELVRGDGNHLWAHVRARPVDAHDPTAGTIWTVSDAGEQKAVRAQLEWSATHDVLTGLANRKMLNDGLAALLEARPHSLPAALVMVDLDRFKPINDVAGHAVGDLVLQSVAAAILSCVRGSDLVVRLGGDEFVLLLAHCAPDDALRIATTVRQAIAAIAVPWALQTMSIDASIGVASLEATTPDAGAWMKAADAACYAAKAEGRGVVRIAPALATDGDHRLLEAH